MRHVCLYEFVVTRPPSLCVMVDLVLGHWEILLNVGGAEGDNGDIGKNSE